MMDALVINYPESRTTQIWDCGFTKKITLLHRVNILFVASVETDMQALSLIGASVKGKWQ